jgi:hypothetical protein
MSTSTHTKSITPTVTPTPPVRQSNGEAESGNGGKRMFRRQNGEMIELPPDMSIMEAVKIELEALAAEKKLGKGQQPKPLKPKAQVVTAAAAADKAHKKVKPKDKKNKTAKKGQTQPKGAGMAAILAAVGKSKIAMYLASLGGPVLMRGLDRLAGMRKNEQTHDTPDAKLSQTKMAVVPPENEGQSKSHGEQVEALGQKPEPKPDPGAAKQSLQKSLDENIPQTIEDVDNFKKNQKATHISRNVMNVVQGDTNDVTDTFGEMEKPRPAAPPTHTPETLPPEEIAPATPNMQLGTGAVAPLKAEHTDMSKFSKDSDDLLKKEEISQEQLDMVDSGDLAEANKDRKKLKKDVKEQPAKVRGEAENERKQVDTNLQQEEQKGKNELKNKRKSGLGATRNKQTGTKTIMEQKREKVASDIKNIYEKAKNKVTQRLAELETQSMKRFDEGNAAASKKFEDDVNKDLAAFKAKRYSGFWGWAKKAKDWLLGMDELPEVNEIFQRNKGIFVDTVNQLVADITADNQKVIKECKAEIDGAKTEIAKYVKNLGPELKSEGDKAMKEMTEKLNMLDNEVAEKEKELAQKLKDKQTAAIKAIDQKIEKMKESMSGALSKLGKLLLEAAKKFFTWALQKFGYSLSEIEGIINKGAAVLKAIFTKPIKFVKNLFNAADQGFSNFGKNFLTHLKNALFSWLTGSLTEVKLPDTWDLKGIASVALQMVGISYQNIRKHLVKIIPEPVVEGMEKGFEIVKALITEGPMAAWEQLQEMAGEMKEAFVDAVKNWIKETIIVKAIEFIASLIIPGAGIIKAIIGIYDTVVFFIQKAKDIAQMVGNFLGSIGEIAMGNIGAAANALENGLATALTLVISFLAKLIHLDGVTAKIRAALNKIRGKVENMMAKVAKWIADKAKKLWGKVTGKDKKDGERLVDKPEERLRKASAEAEEITKNDKTTPEKAKIEIQKLKTKYTLLKADLIHESGEKYTIDLEVNPRYRKPTILKGTYLYPGTLINPFQNTRTNAQLWEDVDPRTSVSGETDPKVRVELAKKALFEGRLKNPAEKYKKALAIYRHDYGKTIMPVTDLSRHDSRGGHAVDRHVMNGSRLIKDQTYLALRAALFVKNAPGLATAFFNQSDAEKGVNNAIQSKIIKAGGWPDFREKMINNKEPNPQDPENLTVKAKGYENRTGAPLLNFADYPKYLEGKAIDIYTITGTDPDSKKSLYYKDAANRRSVLVHEISSQLKQIQLVIKFKDVPGAYNIHTAYPDK